MFDNIGGKIKTWAKVLCWIGMLTSVIVGIVTMVAGSSGARYYGSGMTAGGFFGGLLIAVVGALASWIGSFLLYGFGELIETSKAIEKKLALLPVNSPQIGEKQNGNSTTAPTVTGTWRCQKCGARNPYGVSSCEACGGNREGMEV